VTTLLPDERRNGTDSALPGAGPLGWTVAAGASVGATTLGDLYRSPDVAAIEQRRVFLPAWSLVASTAELAPGHYVTAEPGGAPVVVVRDERGVLRAFHNLCRHRGMPVAEGAGRAGRHLTCPYHQWSFALDGALVRVPQQQSQFADLDTAGWGLHPVAVVEWRGMVFVNPGADPATADERFADALGPLRPYLESWSAPDGGPLDEVAVVRYEVGCNWKLLVENHLDVYHLWYLHQRSLSAYDHKRFDWSWAGDTWWSHEPLKATSPRPATLLGGLDEDARTGLGAHLLFPNLMIVTTGDYLATYDAVPLAPDRTVLTLRVRSDPSADADALVAGIRSFLTEDTTGCERLQSATGSPRFALGPLASDHETPLVRFHAALRARMVP
jgi:phenylpropionate dioxygenase-like ring-hydroxylating dioxygenase large terminal subunit